MLGNSLDRGEHVRAGVLQDGQVRRSVTGTPQGGSARLSAWPVDRTMIRSGGASARAAAWLEGGAWPCLRRRRRRSYGYAPLQRGAGSKT